MEKVQSLECEEAQILAHYLTNVEISVVQFERKLSQELNSIPLPLF